MSCAYLELLAEHACCARTWTPGDRLRLPGHLRRFLRAEAEAAAATSTTASRAAAGLDQRADLLARTVQRAFERGRTIPRPARQSVATAVIDLLTDLTIADRADLESPKPDTRIGWRRRAMSGRSARGRRPQPINRGPPRRHCSPTSTERPTNPSYRHCDEIIADARRPRWRNQSDAQLLFHPRCLP